MDNIGDLRIMGFAKKSVSSDESILIFHCCPLIV